MSGRQTDFNDQIITIIFLVSCSLSVFMSSLISFFYFKYGTIKKSFPAQLIVSMAVLDAFTWSFRIIAAIYKLKTNNTFEEKGSFLCSFFGFLWSFFNLITFFIVLLIAIGIYSASYHGTQISRHKKKCLIFLISPPLILSLIPFLNGTYGEIDEIKCWINEYYTRIFTFYFPLWVIIILNLIFIVLAIIKLRKLPISRSSQRKLAYKIALFPLLMLISWLPSSIRRTLDSDNLALELFMYFVMPLQGVFNPIAYGMINVKVEKKLKAFFFCRWYDLKESETDMNDIADYLANYSNNSSDSEIENGGETS